MAIESKSLETFKQCAIAMAFLSKHMPALFLLTGEQTSLGVVEFCVESRCENCIQATFRNASHQSAQTGSSSGWPFTRELVKHHLGAARVEPRTTQVLIWC